MLSPSAFIAVSAAIALLEGAGAAAVSSGDGEPAQPACPGPFQPFVYAGCFSTTGSSGALLYDSGLPTGNMTVAICTDFCKGNNYKYAGLEDDGKCSCGASIRGHQLPDIDCSTPCIGESSEICGGREGTSVYQDPTFPTVNNTTISDFKLLGCYSEGNSGQALAWKQDQLNESSLTTDECLFACKTGGYDFAGIERASECYCGVVLGNGSAPINPSSCDLGCPGDSSQTCGGSGALTIYAAKDMGSSQPCRSSSSVRIRSNTSASTSPDNEPAPYSMESVPTLHHHTKSKPPHHHTKSMSTSQAAKSTNTSQVFSYTYYTEASTTSSASVSTSQTPKSTDTSQELSYTYYTESTTGSSMSMSTSTSPISSSEYSKPSHSRHTKSMATSHSRRTKTTSSRPTPSSTPDSTESSSTIHHRRHSTTALYSTTTGATKTTASLCTKTAASSPTPTCEYECENWCSSPLPPFNDKDGCLAAAASCSIQVAACFLHAGYPSSIDCFNFSTWCQSISFYCDDHCPGSDCSLDECKSQLPPLNGPPPLHTVRTSVAPCTETTSTKPTSTTSTVPVPTCSNICVQPDNPSQGYSTSSPVGQIPLPILTCNNIESEFNAGNSFKLYTNSSSVECPTYSRSGAGSGCKDACDAQYQSCLENYSIGCKEGKWAGSVTDTYQQATDKCHDQWVACLTANEKVSVDDRCSAWNSGWGN